MKKTKILVPALAVLALGMAASVTGTVAWFAANNVVNANGMQIQSSTPSSLAIGEVLANSGIGDSTVINYAAATNILNPCSHFHGSEATNGSLYTVGNGNDINPATGLAMPYVSTNGLGVDEHDNNDIATETPDGFRDLQYVDATLANHNYVDYVCYLASVGQAITIGTGGYLQVAINWGSEVNQTTYATTVDFWVNAGATTSNDTIGTYVGTLNRAGVLASAGHAGAPKASYTATTTAGEDVTYVTLMEPAGYIPVNTGAAAVRVTMRIYLDGALLETAGKTYVTTNDVDTDGIDINAVFTLERGTQSNG